MAAIFCEKQRKNTKNSRNLAKKTIISSSNVVFYAVYMESYISETNMFFKKIEKNKMAAIFQCKSVNIKENAIKNELIDLKLSRKRGMVCFLVL